MKNICFLFLILIGMTRIDNYAGFLKINYNSADCISSNEKALIPNVNVVQGEDSTGWKPLFNGSDLSGWTIFLGDRTLKQAIPFDKKTQSVFKVANGEIHFYMDSPEESVVPEGFLATEKEYGNYRLKLEFKWGNKKFAQRVNKKRNSGIMYHAQDTTGFWPTSVECQVMEGDVGDIYTQNNAWITTTVDSLITDPLTNNKYPRYSPNGKIYEHGGTGSNRLINGCKLDNADGWNSVEIIVEGNAATYIVNGKTNNHLWNIRYIDPENPESIKPLLKGRIILQAEATEIIYRNVMIKED